MVPSPFSLWQGFNSSWETNKGRFCSHQNQPDFTLRQNFPAPAAMAGMGVSHWVMKEPLMGPRDHPWPKAHSGLPAAQGDRAPAGTAADLS